MQSGRVPRRRLITPERLLILAGVIIGMLIGWAFAEVFL
jgi:hypothetical protein